MGKYIDELIQSKRERISFTEYNRVSDVWLYYEKVLSIVEGNFSFHMLFLPCCGGLLKWKSWDGTSGLKL